MWNHGLLGYIQMFWAISLPTFWVEVISKTRVQAVSGSTPKVHVSGRVLLICPKAYELEKRRAGLLELLAKPFTNS